MANPPFSLKKWGDVEWASDPWGRHKLGGVPPKGYADWAFVQHMVMSAKPRVGRIAVVLPQGALFRKGSEGRIREHLIKQNLVEAVIGLAPNLFYGTNYVACVVVLRTEKRLERRDKILFVNGENLYRPGRNQNTLEAEHVRDLFAAYQSFADQDGFSHVADLSEVESNGFSLVPQLYAPALAQDRLTLEEAVADVEAAHEAAQQTRQALETELAKWGFGLEGASA